MVVIVFDDMNIRIVLESNKAVRGFEVSSSESSESVVLGLLTT